ncbi:MAG: hypothetical protein BGO95_01325 [Micrococcales bacterium 73-13]|nr:MAG: hypothetical protein BGO95_01325 [Micrococcales bacterium 73-13]
MSEQKPSGASWKAAEIIGVILAVAGGLFAAFSAYDSVTVPFLWTAVVLSVLGMIFSGAATFLAPRGDFRAFAFYTGWGLIIGAGVLFWVISSLINAAGL